MHLRTILLATSLIIMGFALSLYFQADQYVQTMNWDQYRNLQYNEERSQTLTDLNEKLVPFELEALIQKALDRNRLLGERTRVMEIEPGNGRVLMELLRKFPEVEFYGINREKTHTFYRRESFILTALKFEIFNREEVKDLELPYVVFQDLDFGARIPYEDNKFDLIFSQSTIEEVKYKFELFNEILRVLRPGGTSIHTDVAGLTVYSKSVVLELRDALAEIRRWGIDIHLLENPRSLLFQKSQGEDLSFPVTPHQPIPARTDNLSQELRRPEMGYNLNL